MQKFAALAGITAPMPSMNTDTDTIILKPFLKAIKRSGLGVNLLDEIRYDAAAAAAVTGRLTDARVMM